MTPASGKRWLPVVVGLLSGGVLAVAPNTALAATSTGSVYTCTGTPTAPGVLVGTHASVVVNGACVVAAGPALVKGSLTVSPGSVLVAAFGMNSSHLTVHGDLSVKSGGTLILGCIPSSFPCIDDPNPSAPTLSSVGRVGGDLDSSQPLGVLVHDSVIGGSFIETGGGGGINCTPSGIFAQFGSPVYSTIEDTSVGGSIRITNLMSCWLGFNRAVVSGNVTINNDQLADPDAIEILANLIKGNLNCFGDSFVWDSSETSFGALWPRNPQPNLVGGHRHGMCNTLENPVNQGGTPGPLPF
jgi:hypothetical protein